MDSSLSFLLPAIIDDWRDRLIGRDEQNQAVFSCTAVLYGKMLEAVKAGMTRDPTFRKIVAMIVPNLWQ